MSKQQDTIKKTICTCIGVDIIRSALSQLGTANRADKSKSALVCYEALNKRIQHSKQQKKVQ